MNCTEHNSKKTTKWWSNTGQLNILTMSKARQIPGMYYDEVFHCQNTTIICPDEKIILSFKWDTGFPQDLDAYFAIPKDGCLVSNKAHAKNISSRPLTKESDLKVICFQFLICFHFQATECQIMSTGQ